MRQYEELLGLEPDASPAEVVAAVVDQLPAPKQAEALTMSSLERLALACERIATVLEAREEREAGA